MAKKIEVIVKQGLKHEGQYQEIGATIKLDAKEAQRLIELGVVEVPPAKGASDQEN